MPSTPRSTSLFVTPGELDLTFLTTFGLSIKPPGDESIGRFGTGLKYAVAGILRIGGEIELTFGDTTRRFWVEQAERAGKTIGFIFLSPADDGPALRLPFVTDLGSHWEPWMFYRELWSNTKDHAGLTIDDPKQPVELANDETCIRVTWPQSIEARALRERTIRQNHLHLIAANASLLMLPRENNPTSVFFRGLSVGNFPESRFIYDFMSGLDLTEDRTMRSEFQARIAIANLWANDIDDEALIRDLVLGEACWEHSLPFTYVSIRPSSAFMQTLWSCVRRLPPVFRSLLESEDREKLERLSETQPGTWKEMIADPRAQTIEPVRDTNLVSTIYALLQAEGRLRKQVDFWRSCAQHLAGGHHLTADEVPSEALLGPDTEFDDEIPF